MLLQFDNKKHTPAEMMAMHFPTPLAKTKLYESFTYYYKPYNYLANTQKFMKFEEEPPPEECEE